MKFAIGLAMLAFAASAMPADAKGCIKGAVVGGIAGHYAGHHGLIGAAAGCAYGRHEANKRDRMNGTNTDRSGRELPNGQERM
jgi:hypothetical protein